MQLVGRFLNQVREFVFDALGLWGFTSFPPFSDARGSGYCALPL